SDAAAHLPQSAGPRRRRLPAVVPAELQRPRLPVALLREHTRNRGGAARDPRLHPPRRRRLYVDAGRPRDLGRPGGHLPAEASPAPGVRGGGTRLPLHRDGGCETEPERRGHVRLSSRGGHRRSMSFIIWFKVVIEEEDGGGPGGLGGAVASLLGGSLPLSA